MKPGSSHLQIQPSHKDTLQALTLCNISIRTKTPQRAVGEFFHLLVAQTDGKAKQSIENCHQHSVKVWFREWKGRRQTLPVALSSGRHVAALKPEAGM